MDIVSRWSSDDFLCLLPNTNIKDAIVIAEKVRLVIEKLELEYDSKKIIASVTIGVSQYKENTSLDETIKLAEDALYKGKNNGRNQVSIAK